MPKQGVVPDTLTAGEPCIRRLLIATSRTYFGADHTLVTIASWVVRTRLSHTAVVAVVGRQVVRLLKTALFYYNCQFDFNCYQIYHLKI
jgi:hypothetical protein